MAAGALLFSGIAALVWAQLGSWNHSTTTFAPASAMACVCRAFCWFLAMALSVSEMATKPRPSSDKPTMTIRLTSSAEPRLSLRFRRRPLILIIGVPQSQFVGLAVLPVWPTMLHFLVTVGSLRIL